MSEFHTYVRDKAYQAAQTGNDEEGYVRKGSLFFEEVQKFNGLRTPKLISIEIF